MPATIDPVRLAEVEGWQLRPGKHGGPEYGACVTEAVSYIAGEPWSDTPRCVCPVIGAFCRHWNDRLDDEGRTRLLTPRIAELVGTKSTPEVEVRRSMMAIDWLIRQNLPAWLDLTPSLAPHAAALRDAREIVDARALVAARPAIDAANAATLHSAREAALQAGQYSALAAALQAGRYAALAAAREAGRYAALAAAREAGRYAALAAARESLAATTQRLQASASDLLTRMIADIGRLTS